MYYIRRSGRSYCHSEYHFKFNVIESMTQQMAKQNLSRTVEYNRCVALMVITIRDTYRGYKWA